MRATRGRPSALTMLAALSAAGCVGAAGAAAACDPSSFKVGIEYDLPSSSDVGKANTADAAGCCAACGGLAGCVTWQWKAQSNGLCTMRNLPPANPVAKDGHTSGTVNATPPPAPPPPTPPPTTPPPPPGAGAYHTNFRDRAAVLREWFPQEDCAHCSRLSTHTTREQCTNMTLSATTFADDGMTHTTRALAGPVGTMCPQNLEQHVCSSGHMTWRPSLLYGNFTTVARFFPGEASVVNSSTAFIGLDSNSNTASITMGFHGAGWPMNGEGRHRYQLGVYAHNDDRKDYPRPKIPRVNTTEDISATYNTYGLLWTPSVVEWRFNGKVVASYANATNIPFQHMHLRLHTRSGYCNQMAVGSSFNATFQSFSYTPYTPLTPP